jgi:hypothetical protein
MELVAPALEEQMLHIDIPTLAEFKALAATKGDACVSLCLPTLPLLHQARGNRMAFKDIAKAALAQLRETGVDARWLAALEQRCDHGADADYAEDQNHIRKLQNGKPIEWDDGITPDQRFRSLLTPVNDVHRRDVVGVARRSNAREPMPRETSDAASKTRRSPCDNTFAPAQPRSRFSPPSASPPRSAGKGAISR